MGGLGILVGPGVVRAGAVEGLHAFALEQADRCPEAIRLAERAIARNPQDAWAVHALAHAMFEDERFDEGVSRLPVAIDPCTHLGWFRNHLLWHLALMHLSRGEYDRVSAMSRDVFERAAARVTGTAATDRRSAGSGSCVADRRRH